MRPGDRLKTSRPIRSQKTGTLLPREGTFVRAVENLGRKLITGAHQVNPLTSIVEDGNAGAETDSAVSVTSSVDSLAVECFGINGNAGTPTITGGQTSRFAINAAADLPSLAGATEAGAATVDMSWEWNGSFWYNTQIGTSLNAAAVVGTKKRVFQQWID